MTHELLSFDMEYHIPNMRCEVELEWQKRKSSKLQDFLKVYGLESFKLNDIKEFILNDINDMWSILTINSVKILLQFDPNPAFRTYFLTYETCFLNSYSQIILFYNKSN